MQQTALLAMHPREAVCISAAIVAAMSITMIAFGWVPHLSVILVLCALLVFGKLKGVAFADMQTGMANGVLSGIGAIYLFFFIGLLVSALMMSGAIPTLMYYGFDLISPKIFYLSAFILTAVIGVAIGSSLTTTATIGVAFLGIGTALGANAAVTAGAIVSGAFFGDKMSPISDTTAIAASVVGIDLFDHIRNMMYTTVPALLITTVLFWLFSGSIATADWQQVAALKTQLADSGLVHWYALLPFVVLIGLAVKKVNAIYTIMITIAVSLAITYCHSQPDIGQLGGYFFNGYTLPENTQLGDVGKLVSRGGVNSMFFTQTIVILALSLGGLLNTLGILPALLAGIAHLLTSTARATFTVVATSLSINVLIGEQYLSLLLAGHTFKPVYEKLHLHPRNIARSIEDAGTVINPLVPWSVCGVFISNMLGVPVLSYLPYAFFCYLSLCLTLIFGFTGWTISRSDQ